MNVIETADLPEHLSRYVTEQDYSSRYNARDQAVWRFVLRKLTCELEFSAHPIYFEGLQKTGINVERIPSIVEMNQCLSQFGWQAVVVDGFIPPQVFMEFQARRILPIAVDIRRTDQIAYTAAPDIIHEAAGHAPIIMDDEYSDYLQRFGVAGQQAMYNQWDIQVFKTVRSLSQLKQVRRIDKIKVDQLEKTLTALMDQQGQPSELALLSRLHWWTVEYGLVQLDQGFRIFGAGLLSSIEESRTCLEDAVVKQPLTVAAMCENYTITDKQPKLFVTKSCRHLSQVLAQYTETMCFRTGGAKAINVAIDAGIVATCVYTSGLQVSARFTHLVNDALGKPIYLSAQGEVEMSVGGDALKRFTDFGSPAGRLCNLMKPLELASEYDLLEIGIKRGGPVCLEFLSGIKVSGWLETIEKTETHILFFSFRDCEVRTIDGRCLHEGAYHMAVGESVSSVFPGWADKVSNRSDLDWSDLRSCEVVVPAESLVAELESAQEVEFYERIRELRDGPSIDESALKLLTSEAIQQCPKAWLLFVEILELISGEPELKPELKADLKTEFAEELRGFLRCHLMTLRKENPELVPQVLNI